MGFYFGARIVLTLLLLRLLCGSLLTFHRGRTGSDGFDDVMITGTAADIAFQPVTDFMVGRGRVVVHKVDRAHHHAWGTETALQAMIIPEGFLHRVQNVRISSQAFDGGYG